MFLMNMKIFNKLLKVIPMNLHVFIYYEIFIFVFFLNVLDIYEMKYGNNYQIDLFL
jgi:hypothetical protein